MALPVRHRDNESDLATWDPLSEINRFREQLRNWTGLSAFPLEVGLTPFADIEETDEGYVFEIDLPGVKREDVNVELSGRRLIVTGERKEKERKGVVRGRTRQVGQFRYEVELPSEIDSGRVEAQINEGTLSVKLPKAAAELPHKISVK